MICYYIWNVCSKYNNNLADLAQVAHHYANYMLPGYIHLVQINLLVLDTSLYQHQ